MAGRDPVILSAAGNRFLVIDGFVAAAPEPARLLERLESVAGRSRPRRIRVDGVLQVLPPTGEGHCRMVLHNLDGSRPEACGNGLRCAAKLAFERGRSSGNRVLVETDAGPRAVDVILRAGLVVGARAEMGIPSLESPGEALPRPAGDVVAGIVDVGNPHCVLFVDDVAAAPVDTLGRELERHPRFAEGTNVEFVEVGPPGLRVRVWERGVGETEACGTGATAAALVAVERGLSEWPVSVLMPGGTLRVAREASGLVTLEGPVEEVSPAGGPASDFGRRAANTRAPRTVRR